MPSKRMFLVLRPDEEEAIKKVIKLSRNRKFPCTPSDAVHWLIEGGILYLKQEEELEAMAERATDPTP
jgi:hypothetical protein